MRQPLVYVSNSYQAPAGMKGFVLEALTKYNCKVIQWGETGTTQGNLDQIHDQVDVMLMVTPYPSHCSTESGVGKGQESELEAYMLGNHDKDEKVYILDQESSSANNLVFRKFGSWWDNDDGNMKYDVSIVSHKGEQVSLDDIFFLKPVSGTGNTVTDNSVVHLALYNKVL